MSSAQHPEKAIPLAACISVTSPERSLEFSVSKELSKLCSSRTELQRSAKGCSLAREQKKRKILALIIWRIRFVPSAPVLAKPADLHRPVGRTPFHRVVLPAASLTRKQDGAHEKQVHTPNLSKSQPQHQPVEQAILLSILRPIDDSTGGLRQRGGSQLSYPGDTPRCNAEL
jgi:hypothetical protein